MLANHSCDRNSQNKLFDLKWIAPETGATCFFNIKIKKAVKHKQREEVKVIIIIIKKVIVLFNDDTVEQRKENN